MRLLTVKDIEEWAKSIEDKGAYILIGDEDPIGREDMHIDKVVRKPHGFSDDDHNYYVLCGRQTRPGCIKI